MDIKGKSIEDILSEEGFYLFTGNGSSMWPLIREKVDVVEIRPCSGPSSTSDGPLKRGDVVIFSSGGKYILHRILEVMPDHYITRGDNCIETETVSIGSVFGVMTGLWRNGKRVELRSMTYRIYTDIVLNHPRMARILRGIFRKLR